MTSTAFHGFHIFKFLNDTQNPKGSVNFSNTVLKFISWRLGLPSAWNKVNERGKSFIPAITSTNMQMYVNSDLTEGLPGLCNGNRHFYQEKESLSCFSRGLTHFVNSFCIFSFFILDFDAPVTCYMKILKNFLGLRFVSSICWMSMFKSVYLLLK